MIGTAEILNKTVKFYFVVEFNETVRLALHLVSLVNVLAEILSDAVM